MRVLLSGGGTGGHIYPALSIAKHCLLHDQKTDLLYIGSENGLESRIVPRENIPFQAIEITGFKRKISLHNVKTVWNFVTGVRASKRMIRNFRPDVVIGTGGYVCGPVLYAAAKLGVPSIIHEQNVLPGLTNSFLSRYTDCVAVSFKGAEANFPKAAHAVYTGNPRASEVLQADGLKARQLLGINDNLPIVVMVGGSRGALALNRAMIEMASFVGQLQHSHIIYITGQPYYDSTRQKIEELVPELPPNFRILPYVDFMPELLAATSLIITRSGATFLAEITALGIPSIQIPSPNVTNNHQEANARYLSEAQAAELILEKDLSGEKLFQSIQRIMSDPIRRESMMLQSKKLGQPDAAELIYQQMIQLINRKK